ncbi:unnamed protein product [Linum tenue]|uniref:Dirigent protein n=1 Tax=Linum tenue TaxID=586396 RepID=A0AAV0M9S7_9ROSI|nr:unnamed protein product [Linum tenue]
MFIFCYSIFIATIINHSSSLARTIANPTPPSTHHHLHQNLTFLMQNLLNATYHAATTKLTSQIPSPKPLGLFPPSTGILIPQQPSIVPTVSAAAGFTKQALTTPKLACYHSQPELPWRKEGVYVASSEDGTSYMVAMTANLNGGGSSCWGGDQKGINGDGLRFFGVHSKRNKGESHIAVIGGAGKYEGANGFAVMEVVDLSSNFAIVEEYRRDEFLLFTVYLG